MDTFCQACIHFSYKMSTKNGKFVSCFRCGVSIYKSGYYLKNQNSFYCSKKCRNFSEIKKCELCNKLFYVKRCRIIKNKNIFCSHKCYGKWKIINFKNNPELIEKIILQTTGVKQSEETVKKRILKNIGKKRTPEQRLRIKMAIPNGSLSSGWKGGISSFTYRLRRCVKMKDWRMSIFERDNWTCNKCGVRGGNLQAHHIKQFSEIIKENNIFSFESGLLCQHLWDINNGLTLCIDCHKKIPVILK